MLLEVQDLSVRYGVITALQAISFSIPAGAIVTLIGSNGAGKTTTLRAISGLQKAATGSIRFDGHAITGLKPHELVKRGIAHVPEGRMVFANLTVLENLRMGAYLQRDRQAIRTTLDFVYTTFPRLQEREKQLAGTLSGGEQQMLAIGRALMSRPRFLMLDEPSLGIAPLLVKTIFEKIVEINRTAGHHRPLGGAERQPRPRGLAPTATSSKPAASSWPMTRRSSARTPRFEPPISEVDSVSHRKDVRNSLPSVQPTVPPAAATPPRARHIPAEGSPDG
jgi:branched-chain amino acid transport system ATP-binding protein